MRSPLFFRRILGFVLLTAVAGLVVVVARYFITLSRSPGNPVKRSDAVDIVLKKIHFTESDASARKWQLFAASGEYDKKADRTSLEEVRFVLERDGRGGPVTVTARHGMYAHASKNVNLHDDVLAITDDGSRFETPRVVYTSANRVLSGSEKVKFVDTALTVEGTGFDINIDSYEINVHSNVSATIYPGKRTR